MPLPPALAARLAKRGILKDASVEGFDPASGRVLPYPDKGRDSYRHHNSSQQEEVFAEDYDDGDTGPPMPLQPRNRDNKMAGQNQLSEEAARNIIDKTRFIGHSGCPNKWNIYHDCSLYCRSQWGAGVKEPTDKEYIRVHNEMVEKYHPLPDGWREMYDAGTGRHYYWCTKTDKVSWLPPGHPRAQPSDAASKLREDLSVEASQKQKEQEEETMSMDSEEESDDEEEENRRLEEKRRKEKEKRKEEERKLKEKRKKMDDDPLDPMDPAAYSDVPRGSWTTGLPDQATAKSGVDSTASGPLFQQRPYPNPGAVLRANAAARGEMEDDD
eukprot:TRINITY_DN8479_c0_g1_i1.p1 TRINITY_DN8479_c0_g1~~TRINITY_DN8479_c0_g1_i1.p1  ORF type:complete len:327 (-),score=89.10 TRINITY_DN8479_c0_g1_i1:3-983(-)